MIFALASVLTAGAQTVFRGKVNNSAKGEGVGYATVAALRESTIAAAVAANANGEFELTVKEEGHYTIEVSAVGFTASRLEAEATGKTVDLGEIALTEGVAVEAVAVTVQRPIVTNDAEKLTYSVEDDPEATTSTLEEIIRKVPQLSIDGEGKVLMNGQNDFKVLVNGRSSGAMARNFDEVIKSMPAASIKRIEVITNPSMKYDAEGAGGILNIITTKTRFEGYNGMITGSAHNNLDLNWSADGSASFTVSKDKFSLGASLFYGQGDMTRSPASTTSYVTEPLDSSLGYASMRGEGDYSWKNKSAWGSINASYQIDQSNLLTAEASLWGGESLNWQTIRGGYYDSEQRPLSEFTNTSTERYPWLGIDAAVNYEHRFKGSESHTLTISDNISVSPTCTELIFQDILYNDTNTTETFEKRQPNRSFENILQIDYRNEFTNSHALEVGAKYSFYNSDLKQLPYEGEQTPISETKLTRNIVGIYAGYGYTHEKVMARVGARLEGAWYDVNNTSAAGDESYRPKPLIDPVPYASVTYLPKMGHSISLSYTERLSRPGTFALSPYVTETQTTREYGNPDLRSGIRHTLSLKYAYADNKWSATVGTTVMLSNNAIVRYSFIDDEGFINSTYGNKGRNRVYSADLALSYRPSKKFSLSFSTRGGWMDISLPAEDIRTRGWAFSETLNMTVALWKGARLTLSEAAMLPNLKLGSTPKSWIVNTSVRLGQRFLKNKLEVALAVNNPQAKWLDMKNLEQTPTYIRHSSHRMAFRSVQLSASYRFGKRGLYVKQTNRKYDDSTSDVGKMSSGTAKAQGEN